MTGLAVVVDPDETQTARDDACEPRGYFIGECGYPVPLAGPICYVSPCGECGDDT